MMFAQTTNQKKFRIEPWEKSAKERINTKVGKRTTPGPQIFENAFGKRGVNPKTKDANSRTVDLFSSNFE